MPGGDGTGPLGLGPMPGRVSVSVQASVYRDLLSLALGETSGVEDAALVAVADAVEAAQVRDKARVEE